MSPSKIVESPHYHLWTDALHARSLSRQANNKWDRGSYIRWAVITSWTVLEIACQKALNEPKFSSRFRDNLELALENKGYEKLNWGSGLWQRVKELQERRNGYVHRFLSEADLFPEATVADQAIDVARSAIENIYRHVDRTPPLWIQDNEDKGWDNGRRRPSNSTLIHAEVSEEDPKAIKIYYVCSGLEQLSEVLPSGTNYTPYVDDLIKRINVPITSVKVYEGSKLVDEKTTKMRGA